MRHTPRYVASSSEAESLGLERMSLDDIHAVTTKLLSEFDAICQKMGLRYSLDYGTLLGAMRHGGPIPWDDDVDVVMPRNDYERLIAELPQSDTAILMDPAKDDYPWVFGKFVDTSTISFGCKTARPSGYGVFLDVFPVDNCPKMGAYLWWTSVRIVRGVISLKFRNVADGRSARWKFVFSSIVRRFVSISTLRKVLHQLCTLWSDDQARNVTNLVSNYGYERDHYPISDFDNLLAVDYDGIKLQVFSNWEQHLERLFGANWRTPIVVPQHGEAYFKGNIDCV